MIHAIMSTDRPDEASAGGVLARQIVDKLHYAQAVLPSGATINDWYLALAQAVRDRLLDRWIATLQSFIRQDVKVVCYLSAEFLMGPHLGNAILALGMEEEVRLAANALGLDLERVIAQEEEPGLGSGGLGRLAACYLDSLATLQVPAIGYGIRYEFGIFDQAIRDGWQVEMTDKWLRHGNPWETPRSELSYEVGLGGRTEPFTGAGGRFGVRWVPAHVVRGIAHDTPVPGYRAAHANLLRLWRAEAVESFDFEAFNTGDYYRAVEDKVASENLTKVLYPNDEPIAGRRLRLEQQYFFVSCSLQDMIAMHLQLGGTLDRLDAGFAAQLNDTHPSIAVAELMRLLVDVHGLEWDAAWDVTRRTLGYTNHTLLPEALETWPLRLFASVLPRHLEIVFEINRRFLDEVRARYPGDEARVQRLSLIDERGDRFVRMAHLATVGSHAVNGVAALHTELLKHSVLRDFYDLWPERFHNITNGVTPRRFVALANPGLSALITSRIGDGWIRDASGLAALEPHAGDPMFRRAWREVKQRNKAALAREIADRTGVVVDPSSLFDIQVKRIHEYKRQHLNVLHVVSLYHRLKRGDAADAAPRTVVFAGKAAPGYTMAKLIIRLINGVGEVVNADPDIGGRLKVVFLPDFNVTNSVRVYPAADLSEQISTAGKEASGTGNMKFAMNGAVTIGTLDGANVEIREEVGPGNFFLFGLTADEVARVQAEGYDPRAIYEANAELRQTLDAIADGQFSRGDRTLFRPLVDALVYHDPYLLLADYQAYVDCQDRVSAAFQDVEAWTRMSIANTARSSWFSSDRAIREYCDRIWDARPFTPSSSR